MPWDQIPYALETSQLLFDLQLSRQFFQGFLHHSVPHKGYYFFLDNQIGSFFHTSVQGKNHAENLSCHPQPYYFPNIDTIQIAQLLKRLRHLRQKVVSRYFQKDLPVKSFRCLRNSMLRRLLNTDFFGQFLYERVVPSAASPLLSHPVMNVPNPYPAGSIKIRVFLEGRRIIYRTFR